MWLAMMVEHHEGAVEMAKEEQQSGDNRQAIALAEQIEKAQLAEVATMNSLQ